MAKRKRVVGMAKFDTYAIAKQEGDQMLAVPARSVMQWGPKVREFGMRCRLHVVRDPASLGISAPQLGIPYRILAYRSDPSSVHVLTNPSVVEFVGGRVVDVEGCFSVRRGMVLVPRFERVVVSACDLAGVPVEVHAEGLVARVLQHEIDHLDGKLITAFGEPMSAEARLAWIGEHPSGWPLGGVADEPAP